MKRVAVGMMVKNEAKIIERALSSIIKLQPELVIITDTGSTDDTIARAGLFLQSHNIKFKIYSELFVDFAKNRSKVLELAHLESEIDYLFMLDADEIIHFDDNFNTNEFKNHLDAPAYDIRMQDRLVSYFLPRLTSNKIEINYIGVTHEYLDLKSLSKGTVYNISIQQINDSNRRTTNKKFEQDVELLENALTEIMDKNLRARYTFYLAQSYSGLGNYDKAIENYKLRTTLGGWEEEIFYSHYQCGKFYLRDTPSEPAKGIYHMLAAYQICPNRIESLFDLKAFFDAQKMDYLSEMLQPIIKKIKHPHQGLFLEDYKYYVFSS